MAAKALHHLFGRWKALSLLENLLLAVAICLPLTVLATRFASLAPVWVLLASLGAGSGSWLWLLWRHHWFSATPTDLAYYLNRRYPALEDSADLLLREPETLSPLARLQRERTQDLLEREAVVLPLKWGRSLGLFAASLAVSAALYVLPLSGAPDATNPIPIAFYPPDSLMGENAVPPPQLTKMEIRVRPPAYTGLKAYGAADPDIKAPEGSLIAWELSFDRRLVAGRIQIGEEDGIRLEGNSADAYTARYVLSKTTFYRPTWRGDDSLWVGSDYFRLEAIPDQAPKIEVTGLQPYLELSFEEGIQIPFTVKVTDDYGISDARMVATLSRGEGESVQFRDDTLRFAQNFRQKKKEYNLRYTLDLDKLGMRPGDELYLHIEAADNRTLSDVALAKSGKFIIAFQNPDALKMDMAGGLAVNRLPEYFRSQRQIIIDTEKLISEEKDLDPETFQQRSNNIAIDQKLLRLRYGQFLGEEFQTVIGAVPEGALDHEEGDGHDHAGEEEHDHAEHAEEVETLGSEDEEIAELEPYYHAHDMSAEATFFDATTKAKLQAALAEMWDAELHLRMGRPEPALPYEYAALKLIKEIQQASRVYVQRIGFEPPTFNEAEKRLTGERDDIANPRRQVDAGDAFAFPALDSAATILEAMLQDNRPPLRREYARLQAAGEELAGLAVERPGAYLQALQQLRSIMENERPGERRQQIRAVQRVLWSLLPDPGRLPMNRQIKWGDLHSRYLEEIQRTP